jgi:hypothetical protein
MLLVEPAARHGADAAARDRPYRAVATAVGYRISLPVYEFAKLLRLLA